MIIMLTMLIYDDNNINLHLNLPAPLKIHPVSLHLRGERGVGDEG
jgi:hypothetical protein